MNPLTGSQIERAQLCAPSMLFPRVERDNDLMKRGRFLHRVFRACLKRQPWQPSEHEKQWADDAKTLESLMGGVRSALEVLGCNEISSETGIMLNVYTEEAKIIGENLDRGYGIQQPADIAMTLDVLASGPNVIVVGDLKTGHTTGAHENPQIRTGARAASLLQPGKKVYGLLWRFDGFALNLDTAVFDELDLSIIKDELAQLVDRVLKAEGRLAKGEPLDLFPSETACKYCPCVPYCPAHTAMVRAVVDDVQAFGMSPESITASVSALSLDRCGEAWVFLERAEAALTHLRDALSARARQEDIPLLDGRIVREVMSTREHLSNQAVSILADRFGQQFALLASSTSKAQIERAIKDEMPGSNAKQLLTAALDDMRKAGAIERRDTATVKAMKK